MTAKAHSYFLSSANGSVVYSGLVSSVRELFDIARHASVWAVNACMTAAYWEIGRRIVEFKQDDEKRAGYEEELLKRLSANCTESFGRGFSRQNLQTTRLFYLATSLEQICQTLSGKSNADSNLLNLRRHGNFMKRQFRKDEIRNGFLSQFVIPYV